MAWVNRGLIMALVIQGCGFRSAIIRETTEDWLKENRKISLPPRVRLIAALTLNWICGCQPATHQVLPNSPKCGCWAISIVGCCQVGDIGGCIGRIFASLRLGGLTAGFLASIGGICSDSGN